MLNIIRLIIAPSTVIPRWARSRSRQLRLPIQRRLLSFHKIIRLNIVTIQRWLLSFQKSLACVIMAKRGNRHKLSSLKFYLFSLFQAELVFPTRLRCIHGQNCYFHHNTHHHTHNHTSYQVIPSHHHRHRQWWKIFSSEGIF